jgi:NADPH2:quinone reductase
VKAWRVHELGRPADVLVLEDVDPPEPGPGQLLVRVLACPANFPDALMCSGGYQVRPPLPFTPGVELCGQVLAVGTGVTRNAVGDRVIGAWDGFRGGFAELALMADGASYPAPVELDDAEAASFHLGHQTAWFGLHRRAQLRAGETLLVHAAAGGVGHAAVQLGKVAGATVIAVVGGPEKALVARDLGADVVIDRTTTDIVDAVKEATHGHGADVVFDPVGGDSYTASTKCIAFEGRLVVVGFASGVIPAPSLGHALVKNYSIVGLHWGLYAMQDPESVRRAHDDLSALVTTGAIRPLVSERLGLAQLADGVQRLADGTTTGRVTYVA